MFLRATKRIKDGKEHRYFSVVENVRHPGSKHPVQKPLLYLGELNDSQQAAWAKALLVCAAATQQTQPLRLFPEDRTPPPDPIPAVQVCWQQHELRHPRHFGDCWLATELWRPLGLDTFWTEKLGRTRAGTDWAKTLLVSAAYRLIAPGSEWKCWRLWYERSALGDLLGPDFHLGNKDQLYAVLDRLLPHREALFQHLRGCWCNNSNWSCRSNHRRAWTQPENWNRPRADVVKTFRQRHPENKGFSRHHPPINCRV